MREVFFMKRWGTLLLVSVLLCVSGCHPTSSAEYDRQAFGCTLVWDGYTADCTMEKGSFTMDGNVVFEGNSATNKSDETDNKGNPLYGKGGALYVTSSTEKVDVNILSGYIRANGSDRLGGGICVDMKEGAEASIVVGSKDAGGGKDTPSITSNHTLSEGGGLYAKGENADITIYHGTINGNSTTAYVHNENVANEGGMVTLVGDEESVDVTHNVVYFHANGEYATFNSETNVSEAIQRIVTSTNSRLVQPAYIARPGYTFVGWHTRADGDDSKGEPYQNGDVMNISADLHLYAQWQKNTN